MAALGFTRASGQDLFSIEEAELSSSNTGVALDGEEVRRFYENLTKETQGQDASTRSAIGEREHRSKRRNGESTRRRRRAGAAEMPPGQSEGQREGQRGVDGPRDAGRPAVISESTMELLGLRLLRCAHEGDTSGLKDLLSKGVDINVQVGWVQLDVFIFLRNMCI
ncbi:hypothetical protein EYF80_062532 [Liparis tanakae]|uniref:Uncharacterized protein n=1 Tax=Liparis tanakae TaxID=230148 RepID=A0A4Z2EFT1_9TELE|nr:hypothetical protein EYF80_062532 [Liparis tanakae]